MMQGAEEAFPGNCKWRNKDSSLQNKSKRTCSEQLYTMASSLILLFLFLFPQTGFNRKFQSIGRLKQNMYYTWQFIRLLFNYQSIFFFLVTCPRILTSLENTAEASSAYFCYWEYFKQQFFWSFPTMEFMQYNPISRSTSRSFFSFCGSALSCPQLIFQNMLPLLHHVFCWQVGAVYGTGHSQTLVLFLQTDDFKVQKPHLQEENYSGHVSVCTHGTFVRLHSS